MIDVMYLLKPFIEMMCLWRFFKRAIPAAAVWMMVVGTAYAQAENLAQIKLLQGVVQQHMVWAGIDIQLDHGWKTYWKTPGHGGIAPRFDWSQSVNVGHVDVQWPVPQHFVESGYSFFGYKNHVVLPVAVTLINPQEKAQLNLRMDYAVCEKLCVPKTALLSLELHSPGKPASAFEAAIIEGFRERVPKTVDINTAFSIASIKPELWENKSALKVTLNVPEGTHKIELFVHDPDGELGVPVAVNAQRQEFMIACLSTDCGSARSTLVVQVDDESVEVNIRE